MLMLLLLHVQVMCYCCVTVSLPLVLVTSYSSWTCPFSQITLAVCFAGWAHVLHGVYKPWGTSSPTYAIQHLSLLVTTLVFLMGLLFKVLVPLPNTHHRHRFARSHQHYRHHRHRCRNRVWQVDGVSLESPEYRSLSYVLLFLCLLFGVTWLFFMGYGVVETLRKKRLARQEKRNSAVSAATTSTVAQAANASQVLSESDSETATKVQRCLWVFFN